MKVRDVMSAVVTALRADTPIQVAASMLVSHGPASARPQDDLADVVTGMLDEHRQLRSEQAWLARAGLGSHDRG